MNGNFQNRIEAGRRLAEELRKLQIVNPLVLALPRGGVVGGAEVARILNAQLDIILVKKLRSPAQSELALGAIGEGGVTFIDQQIVQKVGVNSQYLEEEIQGQLSALNKQSVIYRKALPKVELTDREIILVDDGVATGSTMIAAIQVCSVANPKRIVVAVPVAPSDTVTKIKSLPKVNDVVCLMQPHNFHGVGQFYQDFAQVPDETVIQILQRSKQ